MKLLLSTTAVVIALGLPGLALAQTATPATPLHGVLIAHGQSDLFTAELIGHEVFARRTAIDMTASSREMTQTPEGTRNMMLMPRADLDGLDAIGQVNEVVLSSDGQVRALVIGVGWFLGMGSTQVSVGFKELTILSNAAQTELRVYIDTTREQVQAQPEYRAVNLASIRTEKILPRSPLRGDLPCRVQSASTVTCTDNVGAES